MSLSDEDIVRIAQQEGIRPEYLLAIRDKENSKDSDISSAGAVGRFQILPRTFKDVHPQGDINDPEDNAIASARYLKKGLEAGNGDFQKAAAYYYAGPSWQQKAKTAPGKRYGTNPDGSAGISIEDYAKKAGSLVSTYAQAAPPDNAMLGGLDAIDAQIAKLGLAADKQLENTQEASVVLSERIRQNIQKQANSVRKEGELAATVELNKFQQQQQRAGEASANLSRLGINTSDLDSTIAQISQSIQEDFQVSQGMRAQIEQKQQVSLLDDPIEYLMNQFTVPGDIRAHNRVVQRMRAQKHYVDQATDIATKVQQVNAAKFTSVSLEGAKASAEILRTKAEVDAIKLEDTMLKQDFDTQVRTLGIIQSRMTNLSAMADAEVRRGVRGDIAAAKAAKEDAIQLDDSNVLIAGRILGMEVPTRKVLDKMPKDVKNAIEYVMANGGGIGKDPLEALQVLRRGDPAKMPPAVKYQMDMLTVAAKDAMRIVDGNAQLKTGDPKQKMEAVASEMRKYMARAAADPNFSIKPTFNGTVDNPYHIPAFDVMRALPESRGLPITKIIDGHMKTFPGKPVQDTLVLELAYENIGEGKPYRDISDAARDVARFYKEGVNYNNQKMKFTNFGMEEQTTYNVGKINFAEYESVMKNYLLRQRAEFNHPDFGRYAKPGEPFRTVEEKEKIKESPLSKPAFSKGQIKKEAGSDDSMFFEKSSRSELEKAKAGKDED